MARAHNERCPECKKRIRDILSGLYGTVESYDLDLPASLAGYKGTISYDLLENIHAGLQRYRGFVEFVRSKKLPRVDFFIPKRGLIIEFDESQHFTKPREIALSYYPNEHRFGFSVHKWRTLCLALDKRDNHPAFRDEQRAWYDTLRDFAPMLWGKGQILRLYARDQPWCSLRPNDQNDLEKFERAMSLHSGGIDGAHDERTGFGRAENPEPSSHP